MVIDVSPEYAEALCTHGSTEQTQMILRFQEQTAAELSNCGTRGTVDQDYKNNNCDGCLPGQLCLDTDSITIDPTMFGWCVPKRA